MQACRRFAENTLMGKSLEIDPNVRIRDGTRLTRYVSSSFSQQSRNPSSGQLAKRSHDESMEILEASKVKVNPSTRSIVFDLSTYFRENLVRKSATRLNDAICPAGRYRRRISSEATAVDDSPGM